MLTPAHSVNTQLRDSLALADQKDTFSQLLYDATPQVLNITGMTTMTHDGDGCDADHDEGMILVWVVMMNSLIFVMGSDDATQTGLEGQ